MMRRGTGPTTQWLILINAAVFVVIWLGRLLGNTLLIERLLAITYVWVLQGLIWQPFTAMFAHVSPFHILFNMFALWQYGALNERLYSRKQYLTIYLGSGLIGNIASLLIAMTLGELGTLLVGTSSLGASGAVFGLIGSFVAYAKGTRSYGTAVLNAVLVFAMSSFAIGVVNGPAHLFGLLGGYTLARYFIKPVESVYSVQYQVVGPPPEYPWRLSGPEGRI